MILFTKTVIGTPQALCRETHQSGRCFIIVFSLLCPRSGINRVSSMALKAASLRSFVSIEINHWGVVRKIKGALDLQE